MKTNKEQHEDLDRHMRILGMPWPHVVKECESYADAPDHIVDICKCSHLSIAKPITLKQLNILRTYLEERDKAGTRKQLEH